MLQNISAIDQKISLFEKGEEVDLHDELLTLLEHLWDHLDSNFEPHALFQEVQTHCTHDLELFLYEYIFEQIEVEDLSYAEELIEGYYPFFSEKLWFDYLRIRIEILKEAEEGFEKLEYFIKVIDGEVDLQLEILSYLSQSGNHFLFSELAIKTLFQLEEESQFLELAEIALSHFRYLELESISSQIEQILEKRPSRPDETPFSKEDPDLFLLHPLLAYKVFVAKE